MPTTYSNLLRFALQATGENNNTWGTIANANTFEMFEDAIAGMAAVNLTGSGGYTLTTANGSTDESRCAMLKFTGAMTAARTVTIPASTKMYIAHNTTTGGFDVTLTTGSGTTTVIAPNTIKTVYCDGTNVFEASTNNVLADGIIARDFISLTSASSPYSVTSADSGKILVCDTSSGSIVVNAPAISTLPNPFNVGVYKLTSDVNTVTFNRGGSDVIGNGATSAVITRQEGSFFGADPDPATDRWVPIGFGASVTVGQTGNQTFTAPGGFTPGTTTTLTITNAPIPPTSASLAAYFDGVRQLPNTLSYNPTTGVVTHGAPIPVGVQRVFYEWQSVSLPSNVPSLGSITYGQLASSLPGTAADIQDGTIEKLAMCDKILPALRPYSSVQAATSGSSLTFSGIPTGMRRFILMLDEVRSTGGVLLDARLNGEATGYTGTHFTAVLSSAYGNAANSTGASLTANSVNPNSGAVTFYLSDPATNTWVWSGSVGDTAAVRSTFVSGRKSISAVLNSVTVLLSSGTFNNGKITLEAYPF